MNKIKEVKWNYRGKLQSKTREKVKEFIFKNLQKGIEIKQDEAVDYLIQNCKI